MKNEQVQAVVEMLRHLAKAFASASYYSPSHPQVVDALAPILDALRRALAQAPELTLIIVKDDLLLLGKPLERNPSVTRVAAILSRCGLGHLRFSPEVEEADLRQLIRCVAGQEGWPVLQEPFSRISVGAVDVAPPEMEPSATITSFEALSSEQRQGLQDLFHGIAGQQPIDTHELVNLIGGFVAAFQREANPLMALVPLRMVDDYTFTHSVNVGILNLAQAMSLGIEGELLHDIGIAGMLHDAGKIFIDQEIIQKAGKLTPAEWSLMQTHPSRGAQYLMGQGVPMLAVICAYEHHLRYDLSGYPAVPVGWPLHLVSQLTMISDIFDALRTRRIYRSPWDFAKVSGHLLELSGTALHPDLTLNFLELLARLGENLPVSEVDDTRPARHCYCE